MIRNILILLFGVWGNLAYAQGTILSGEHDDYTRIVVPIGEDREFTLEQEDSTRIIVLDPPGEFDSANIFRPLFADRLAALDTDGNVSLELGCDCEVRAYRYLDEYLVLDIFETANFPGELPQYPSTTARMEGLVGDQMVAIQTAEQNSLPADAPTVDRALAARTRYRPLAPLNVALLPEPSVVVAQLQEITAPRRTPAADNVADMNAAEIASEPESPIAPNTTPAPLPVNDPSPAPEMAEAADSLPNPDSLPSTESVMASMTTPPAIPDGLDATVQSLAQQLSRATAAGLLDPAARTPLSEGTADEPQDINDQEEDTIEGDPLDTSLPVRAANAFDIASLRDSSLAAVAAALSCAQPIGNLEDWAQGEQFSSNLGAMRQAIFDADGNILTTPTLKLARHYVFHGFGAEAEALLLTLENPPEVELAMARYLDDRPGPNFPAIETLALCSGLDMLWRFVDAPQFPELAAAQRESMRLAFSDLPAALRRMIGPDFVRRLDEAGYDDDATDVREALARGQTLDETEIIVLEFETSNAPPTRSATERLENQLGNAGPDAARVMREFLAALRRAGDNPDPSQMITAEALLRETPLDRSVGSLWYEVLMAHAGLGDMETAFSMLNELAGAAPEMRHGIDIDMVDMILRSNQTAALVVMSTRLATQPGGHNLPLNQRQEIFDGLMGLGLADLAEPFSMDQDMPERLPLESGQNWAAAAGTDSAAAAVAQRVADLETMSGDANLETPDDVRNALADSRSLRAQLSELLGELPAN